jgi:hypothetical protein
MCSGDHFVSIPNTAGCAYSEGWADYFSISTLPTQHQDLNPAQFELNSWVLQYPTQGLYIEGAVAADYLDMSDGVSAGESDNQALSGVFVANIISSCEHIYLGAPYDVGGLRFCFEQNLTPSSNYRLAPTVSYPPQWTLGPMQVDYNWNIKCGSLRMG